MTFYLLREKKLTILELKQGNGIRGIEEDENMSRKIVLSEHLQPKTKA